MKITREVEIEPFNVPNFVRISGEPNAAPIAIGDLPMDAIEALLRQFREDIIAKTVKCSMGPQE